MGIKLSTFLDSPFEKGVSRHRRDGVSGLPYNAKLKEKTRALRKSGNLSEVLLWNKLKRKKMLGFDFTRQQIIGNYDVKRSQDDVLMKIYQWIKKNTPSAVASTPLRKGNK